jgi:excinuclease ABC subunit C
MFPDNLLDSIPRSPGVYLMLDKKAGVIYIGKAKDLRARLGSYKRVDSSATNKTAVMLSHVHKVDTLLTRTEKEALILEASLIKQHRPRYNIILRDDKNYPSIKVTVQEQWPRLLMTRRQKKDGARYFGPYASSSAMWTTLKLLATLFPLRRCKSPRLLPRARPCLNGQMHHCLAPCVNYACNEQYHEMVSRVIMFLEGQNRELIASMTLKMNQCATELDFEQAALIRDQIQALSRTLEKQIIVATHGKDQDIFGMARESASLALAILMVRNGIISGSRTFFLADPIGEDSAILSQVLLQHYDQGDMIPKEIFLPCHPEDQDLVTERLSELRGDSVQIQVPQRGNRLQLIAMANANARQVFAERHNKELSWQALAAAMVKNLHLRQLPDTIECLDISNISGRHPVGSLVCFERGEPAKHKFRHYKIKTITGPDDYAMMAEALERRLKRGIAENDLPDLFMVDGGRGQLGVAMRIAKKLGLDENQDLEWIGIAKEKQEEGEKLYKPARKNPIILPPHNPALIYLMRIRDESHRFGVSFHRKLRDKATLTSELDEIGGIGPRKKQMLLKQVGSLTRIKKASLEKLVEVPGIGPELARIIHQHFHPET